MWGCGAWALLTRGRPRRAKGVVKAFHFLGDEDSQSTSAGSSTPLSKRSSKTSQISSASTNAGPCVHFDLSANVVAERAWVDKVAANSRGPRSAGIGRGVAGEELPAEELTADERVGLALTIRQSADWLTAMGMPAYGKHLVQWLSSRLHDGTCIVDLEEGDAEGVRKWISEGLRVVASGGAVDLTALIRAASHLLEFRTDAGHLRAREELRAAVRAMREEAESFWVPPEFKLRPAMYGPAKAKVWRTKAVLTWSDRNHRYGHTTRITV